MKTALGRHVLVVISDGLDHGSKETLNEAVDAAERSGITLYTVLLKGERDRDSELPALGGDRRGGIGGNWPGGGGRFPGGRQGGGGSREPEADGKKTLEKIAERSGGRAFEAKKKDSLEEQLTQIAAEIDGQVLLTYTPDVADKEGGFHKVSVKAANGEWTVAAPEGYFAPGGGER